MVVDHFHALCSCRTSATWSRNTRSRALRLALKGSAEAPEAVTKPQPVKGISGTWDFKWRQGSRIRVAFQALTEGRRAQLGTTELDIRKQVMDYASRWTRDTSVKFEFQCETPFPAPLRGQSPSGPERQERLYDVLVSLEPLPMEEPDTVTDRGGMIAAPTAQLGSYARRADYGVPTVYLGRQNEQQPLDEYFASKQFETSVTHEFGHVLGLAHEHQNPKRKLRWKSWQEIQAIIREFWNIEDKCHPLLSQEYIETEIITPWPGNPKFSDWRDGQSIDSVMANPLYEAFLQNAKDDALAGCKVRLLTEPTQDDLAQVVRMYPSPRATFIRGLDPKGGAPRADEPPESRAG